MVLGIMDGLFCLGVVMCSLIIFLYGFDFGFDVIKVSVLVVFVELLGWIMLCFDYCEDDVLGYVGFVLVWLVCLCVVIEV